ncbi:MAG: hypothetical protein HKN74_10760 [Acidimicrobiia bacterium]|nr:hypothetical protein [Acidimicrobiia bacterium]MBT8216003.1 hypothetical protein [Acidimicrobiia bacterium]NNF10754.1 hypothetical protein [Acidimicrobiia bacterium]NNL69217.1 hypothetical protein [Acidimicrobiia bacterium]
MGQEPKVEIPSEDLPRTELEPAPARRWKATRPGDLHRPEDVPWGGAFGTPGPDTGYALKLTSGAEFELGEGESRSNVEHLLLLIMGARASLFGKAPSADDLSFALLLLGLDHRVEVPDAARTRLAESRRHWALRVPHSKAADAAFGSMLTPALLSQSSADLRHRLSLGEMPLAAPA